MELVRELRDEIVEESKSLSSILRKAKIVASLLDDADLKRWLDHELSGYDSGADLPLYRKLQVPLLGDFYGPMGSSLTGYSIPISFLPDTVREFANDLPVVHPVREIESMAASASEGLRNRLPTEAVILSRDKVKVSGGLVLAELYQPITRANLESILDAVRTRFLDFLLALQEIDARVLDSEAALEELPKEKVSKTFNVTVYGDHNVIAAESRLGDVTVETVKENDLASLVQLLTKLGVGKADLTELQTAIEEDGPRPNKSLGSRVQAWIGDMLSKAVGGTWKVALTAAPGLLKEAIFRYYGWK